MKKNSLYSGHIQKPVFSKALPIIILGSVFSALLLHSNTLLAESDSWQTTNRLQSYWQTYNGSSTRNTALNMGVSINKNYLETASVGLSYNFTFLDLVGDATLSENILRFSGQYHVFLDQPAGKLSLRMDAYLGQNTLKYRTTSPGELGVGMGRRSSISGSSSITTDSVDIGVYNPILAYMNQEKTFYLDLGYAYSEYRGTTVSKANQTTPTIGLGWNEQYDWLQLRAYLIDVEDDSSALDQRFESLEFKYTHWFSESTQTELIQLSALVGERLLAVDPDAIEIYSVANEQTGSVSAAIQWKLATASKLLTLISYSEFRNNVNDNNYDALTLYLNIQSQW